MKNDGLKIDIFLSSTTIVRSPNNLVNHHQQNDVKSIETNVNNRQTDTIL